MKHENSSETNERLSFLLETVYSILHLQSTLVEFQPAVIFLRGVGLLHENLWQPSL